MSDPSATSVLSGKELARERRRAISQNGRSAMAKKTGAPASVARPAPAATTMAAPVTLPAPVATSSAGGISSGREVSRSRRAMMATSGKNGVAGKSAPAQSARVSTAAPAPAITATSAPEAETVAETLFEPETALESLCDIVEGQPASESPSGAEMLARDICRARRQALSSQGKRAMPVRPGSGVAASARRNGNGNGNTNGRDLAQQRRVELSQNGRGKTGVSRPSGRVRPAAPPKVEVGTTLSGQSVTGNQVERSNKVTGNEPGTCRGITGTEYIGGEQFAAFCETRPSPAAAKIGMSATSRGQWVSGTEVGRSTKVTGDEPGSCRPVSGTEYLGSERFSEFCEGKGLLDKPEKVAVGTTARRGLAVTGFDEARLARATGGEPGANRAITGSQYNDAGVARLTINGASKVALTHTVAGRPVSGTEVGRSVKVTGDEAGSCRAVSGTEYLSNEQFSSVCNTRPEPTPTKVGEDASRGGQRITGNMMDRGEKVTGNEPGTSKRVTGSQYGKTGQGTGGAEKTAGMHTLAGRALTGSRLGHSPKLSGDEHGGCQPVTGTEYFGKEQFVENCAGTPEPAAAKVGISQSNHGLPVSGTLLGRSGNVTGNEPGSALPISGTPYAGKEQIVAGQAGAQANVVAQSAAPASKPAPSRIPRYLVPAGQSMPRQESLVQAEVASPRDFSIVSPSRQAQDARERITGNAYGAAGRVTGPINMAAGLVSGTPEFRYRDEMGVSPLAAREVSAPEAAAPSRFTGDGRDSGMRITGDDWARGGHVTGTVGRWAQGRNPTQRGEAQQPRWARDARANKDRERPEEPVGKVTGSSGQTGKGALITLSGGARG
ncbi:MAG: CsoS2 family carboxysome shell protein [Gallionellaceae bacterium]|nr:CsoS2 family carboxysome shell protein [Gallionellaceae bacterium]